MSAKKTTGESDQPSTGRRRKKRRRTDLSYIKSARKLSDLKPSLKKYSTRQYRADALKGKLSPAAKAAITLAEKKLRHTENLHKLDKRSYKRAKKLGIAEKGGIQGIRLRNTENGAKIRVTKRGLKVGTNGRAITYEIVEPPELENLIEAAARAFGEELEIDYDEDGKEKYIEIVRHGKETERRIKRKQKFNVTVWLWTIAGRASRGFRSLALFIEDISKAFQAYSSQAEWIRGIAWLKEKSSR